MCRKIEEADVEELKAALKLFKMESPAVYGTAIGPITRAFREVYEDEGQWIPLRDKFLSAEP